MQITEGNRGASVGQGSWGRVASRDAGQGSHLKCRSAVGDMRHGGLTFEIWKGDEGQRGGSRWAATAERSS